jgi:hypothetical protein
MVSIFIYSTYIELGKLLVIALYDNLINLSGFVERGIKFLVSVPLLIFI